MFWIDHLHWKDSHQKKTTIFVQPSTKNADMCGLRLWLLDGGFHQFFSVVIWNLPQHRRRRVQPTDLWSVHHPLGRGDGKRLAHLLHWRCSVQWFGAGCLGWSWGHWMTGLPVYHLGFHDWIIGKVSLGGCKLWYKLESVPLFFVRFLEGFMGSGLSGRFLVEGAAGASLKRRQTWKCKRYFESQLCKSYISKPPHMHEYNWIQIRIICRISYIIIHIYVLYIYI